MLEEGNNTKNIGVSVSSLDEVFMRIESQALLEVEGDSGMHKTGSVRKAAARLSQAVRVSVGFLFPC